MSTMMNTITMARHVTGRLEQYTEDARDAAGIPIPDKLDAMCRDFVASGGDPERLTSNISVPGTSGLPVAAYAITQEGRDLVLWYAAESIARWHNGQLMTRAVVRGDSWHQADVWSIIDHLRSIIDPAAAWDQSDAWVLQP